MKHISSTGTRNLSADLTDRQMGGISETKDTLFLTIIYTTLLTIPEECLFVLKRHGCIYPQAIGLHSDYRQLNGETCPSSSNQACP